MTKRPPPFLPYGVGLPIGLASLPPPDHPKRFVPISADDAQALWNFRGKMKMQLSGHWTRIWKRTCDDPEFKTLGKHLSINFNLAIDLGSGEKPFCLPLGCNLSQPPDKIFSRGKMSALQKGTDDHTATYALTPSGYEDRTDTRGAKVQALALSTDIRLAKDDRGYLVSFFLSYTVDCGSAFDAGGIFTISYGYVFTGSYQAWPLFFAEGSPGGDPRPVTPRRIGGSAGSFFGASLACRWEDYTSDFSDYGISPAPETITCSIDQGGNGLFIAPPSISVA